MAIPYYLFVSFGQKHTHSHNDITLDKDIIGRVSGKDYAECRAKLHELFDSDFAFDYEEKTMISVIHSFPRGIVDLETNKKVTIYHIKFRGIDDWNRPVYKSINSAIYFGSTSTLFPDPKLAPNNTTEEINNYFRANRDEIEYFGQSFDCEPHGGTSRNWIFNIID